MGLEPPLAGVGILCRFLNLWRNRWNNQFSVIYCLEMFSPCISHDLLSMDHKRRWSHRHNNRLHWGGGKITRSQMIEWNMQMSEVKPFHLSASRGQKRSSIMNQHKNVAYGYVTWPYRSLNVANIWQWEVGGSPMTGREVTVPVIVLLENREAEIHL